MSVPDLSDQVYANVYQLPVPSLAVQIYANVGTGLPPSFHRVCACEFEYHYRWPQFYDALLSDDPERRATAVEILEERDRALEQHLHERCGPWGAPVGLPETVNDFEYPTRWTEFYDALLSADRARVDVAVAVLDERDRALESHIAGMTCFGVDYSIGITCEFDYPTRWTQLAPMLLSGDTGQVREVVGLLQVRDIALETNLTNRKCGDTDVHGLYPDLVMQVYENVT